MESAPSASANVQAQQQTKKKSKRGNGRMSLTMSSPVIALLQQPAVKVTWKRPNACRHCKSDRVRSLTADGGSLCVCDACHALLRGVLPGEEDDEELQLQEEKVQFLRVQRPGQQQAKKATTIV